MAKRLTEEVPRASLLARTATLEASYAEVLDRLEQQETKLNRLQDLLERLTAEVGIK